MGLMLERQHPARIAAPLPQPEEVFLSWLVAQPEGADLAAAADTEIHRLEDYLGAHAGPRRLKELFIELRRELTSPPVPRTPQ